MKVKELCNVLMDNSKITIVSNLSDCNIIDCLTTNQLRHSKYKNAEVDLLTAPGVAANDFYLIIVEE